MSASFDVICATGSYRVEIRSGLLTEILEHSKDTIVLSDERFSSVLSQTKLSFLTMPANETAKSLDAMPAFITDMRRLGMTRNTKLIAIGGGIVQDVATFCASVFMRGLSWSYFPTTLLGMVDSCIGGKSSINVGEYKNLAGTFHPPTAVHIDPVFTRTLLTNQMVEGLCEAVKICFCRGPAAFDDYLRADPSPDMPEVAIEKVIRISLASKRWFIEIDEFDRAERQLLNFGHTFGHALEGATHFGVSHGAAVGFGILCALTFGESIGRNYLGLARVEALKSHVEKLLFAVPELPKQLQGVTAEQCFERFLADKKHARDHFALIVVDDQGGVEKIAMLKTEATQALVVSTFDRTIKAFQS